MVCSEEARTAFGLDSQLMGSQLAEAMAEVARHKLGADVGIGTAGEGGKIFIGLDSNRFKRSITRSYLGDRLRTKQRAVNATLFELRKTLLEEA